MSLKRTIHEKAKAGIMRRPGQAAENLMQILETHNSKRERLSKLSDNIAAYLPNLEERIKDNLKIQFGRDVEDILTDVQTQLHREECPILLAGETSSGKSMFLNLLLGEDILPVSHLSSTSTICEVKYGETKKAVVHPREKSRTRTVTIPLDGSEKHKRSWNSTCIRKVPVETALHQLSELRSFGLFLFFNYLQANFKTRRPTVVPSMPIGGPNFIYVPKPIHHSKILPMTPPDLRHLQNAKTLKPSSFEAAKRTKRYLGLEIPRS
ncbi:hypothetical protein Bbelb_199150 [Branchiostoma belcheri]|nr:hypothetical protein Bbelb_199150 [Branchiostoma belcheri]